MSNLDQVNDLCERNEASQKGLPTSLQYAVFTIFTICCWATKTN